jgi:polyhydroxyalkanoate synthesis regulator phasin
LGDESKEGQGGLSEGLRTAIERTFSTTADSAAETRERAQELLDEVARRGQDAREAMARRGQEAREASAGITTRVVEAIQDMRLATAEELRELRGELDRLESRIAALEEAMVARGASAGGEGPETGPRPHSQLDG